MPSRRIYKMPTAILLSHMPEGFFVAADGRSLRDDGTVFSDTEQKIFPFEDERGCFAFAITGMVAARAAWTKRSAPRES